MQEPAGHVFISYVHEDSDHVDALQQALQDAGVRVWRDKDDLWPGDDWRMMISRAITDNALVFIACFSSHSAARTTSYQNEELTLATEQFRLRPPDARWLIPLRFDDCQLPRLNLGAGRTLDWIQRADLFGDRREAEMQRLVTTVQGLLRQPRLGQDTGAETAGAAPHVSSGTSAAPAAPRGAGAVPTAVSPLDAILAARPPRSDAEILAGAVQRLKQALPDPTRRVELADLVNSEIQQLAAQISDTAQHPLIGVPFPDQLTAYEKESTTAASLLATGVFHDDQTHTSLWISGDMAAIRAGHLTQAPPEVPSSNVTLKNLISRLIAKDPGGRPQDARAVLDRLRRAPLPRNPVQEAIARGLGAHDAEKARAAAESAAAKAAADLRDQQITQAKADLREIMNDTLEELQAVEPDARLREYAIGGAGYLARELTLSVGGVILDIDLWEGMTTDQPVPDDTMILAGCVMISNPAHPTQLNAANIVYEQVGDRLGWRIYKFRAGIVPPNRYPYGPYGAPTGCEMASSSTRKNATS